MQRAHFLVALLCVAIVSPVFPLTLSLDDAIQQGLENSLSLKKSRIDLSTAEYSANRLWSEVFPTISGSFGAAYNSRVFSDNGAGATGGSLNTSLGITLGLNAGIPYTMKNIRLAYQTRLLGYEDACNQLEIQITKNFYSLIADRDNLESLVDMLNLAQMQYERDQVAFNNGLIRRLVLLQSQLSVENARYNLSAARSAYANRMGDFLSLLGIAQDAEITLEGVIEIVSIELDAEQLIREYLPRRPDIISRRQEIERLENAERQIVLSGRAPSLSLSAQWRASDFDPFADTFEGRATVNIPIDPWIAGTSRSQSVRGAKDAVEKAKLDLQSAEDSAMNQIRTLAANLHNSWDSIQIARFSRDVAEQGYELTEQGFRSGTVDSLRLEDARNNLVNARQRLLQSELSYLNMILDISAALNINWKDIMK